MRQDEIRDVGRIVGAVLGGGVALVEDLHRAIAQRSFGASPSNDRSAKIIHDGVARAAYGMVASGSRAAPRLLAAVTARAVSTDDAVPLDSQTKGNAALGALNGLWGDRLAASALTLALGMTVRHGHADLPLTADAGRDCLPEGDAEARRVRPRAVRDRRVVASLAGQAAQGRRRRLRGAPR